MTVKMVHRGVDPLNCPCGLFDIKEVGTNCKLEFFFSLNSFNCVSYPSFVLNTVLHILILDYTLNHSLCVVLACCSYAHLMAYFAQDEAD